ncbi:uncharacterized protein [Triticum aestivum]|uniref:uncharacterized protein isoform X2 n=1 Tax=Triticum aestivum TaxID=4565 RepID=UPI000E7A29A4|nr:uncharacterized protein LOC123112632 isoform X2 [Triticum aestivum]
MERRPCEIQIDDESAASLAIGKGSPCKHDGKTRKYSRPELPESLFHGDNLHEHSIQEVDMDTEDTDDADDTAVNTQSGSSKKAIPESADDVPDQEFHF